MQTTVGRPYPLGATVDEHGVNFALFSAHATAVTLCVFDSAGENELARYPLTQKSQQVWHLHIECSDKALVYGYRVDGPYEPHSGHRFNANKLLLDPYAKQWLGQFIEHQSHYGYCADHALEDLSFDECDNAAYMPKCKVVDTSLLSAISPLRASATPITNDLNGHIIYELHVKGFTQLCGEIEESIRGSYLGLAEPNVLRYLTELGVTCVELLPVHSFISEAFLQDKQLTNYWGYNSLSFFVPQHQYQSDSPTAPTPIEQFRNMVSALHGAGIEVILDVVYNHTAEGNRLGPTLCFKGIDNLSYYGLLPSDKRFYINDTGCGNTLNISHPKVLQLVMDSLRYWVEIMGVDGFRFDLASCLGRESHGFDKGAGFFDAIAQDPVLNKVKLIAEPWDIGPGGYQLGGYPQGWSEWNDRYRDTVRRFWRGDFGMLPELARRLHGSSDLFEHADRGASSSINFITSHDGFSLHDLVSYCQRHNDPNGEQSRDGHQENHSHNYGEEGESNSAAVNALRQRQVRNMLTTLVLSQGVPMLLAGDEIGHSLNGNNNAYCQDNSTNWRDWSNTAEQRSLLHFVKRLIAIRKRFCGLYPQHFIHQNVSTDGGGLGWFCRQGEPMNKLQWGDAHTRSLSLVLCGEVAAEHSIAPEQQALLLMLNADDQSLVFNAPSIEGYSEWHCLLHTQTDDDITSSTVAMEGTAPFVHQVFSQPELGLTNTESKRDTSPSAFTQSYQLKERSVMLFYAQLKGATA
ncbi:glycogen debranching enzyme GlgX [Shewanella sp. Choline-02u-19]|uniref:glycogen debranching protein GlgX n=1 Tax=unclassified Shewanella TaxID=196818 RepID=UPI000C329417|nr:MULTISPECIES: glycogen debranching protein GlgX [unclassified Shewanella]PKH57378.1 glycogen debranching enzyme GlgX [Shewanella sp. Bg11-22]PKI28321.1 glycogen debranching enzyme GlgX [Shewanella sp. Choline-02u-19]